MLDALVRALSQMISPEFRAILWKSVAYALVLIVLIAVGVERLSAWLASVGESWAEGVLGGSMHAALVVLAWILSVAAGIGIVIGSIFLMPAVTALVGSFFVDDIAPRWSGGMLSARARRNTAAGRAGFSRGCQDGSAGPCGVPGGGPIASDRRGRCGHFLLSLPLTCSGVNISRLRRCVTIPRVTPRLCASETRAWCSSPDCSLQPLSRSRSSAWPLRCLRWR